MIKWGKVKEPSAVLSWREDVTAAKELLYPKDVTAAKELLYPKEVIRRLEDEPDPNKRQRILHDARHRM